MFVSIIVRSEALVYNSLFFSERPFYGNYSTLNTNTEFFFLTGQDGFQNLDKAYTPLSRGGHFFSGDLESFVYAGLAFFSLRG